MTILVCGDSQISVLGSGPREELIAELERLGYAISMVGSQWSIAADQTTGPFLQLPMAEHAGRAGYTIAHWRDGGGAVGSGDGLAVEIAASGSPDVAVSMLGTNDVAALAALIAAASTDQATALAAMKADTLLLAAKWRSLSPRTRVVYSTIPPYVTPAAHTSEGATLRAAFNAWLVSGSGLLVVDAGGGLGDLDVGADGIHLTRSGCTTVGAAWARAVAVASPYLPAGPSWPLGSSSPPFVMRGGQRQKSVAVANTSAAIDFGQLNGFPRSVIGAASFLFAFNYFPTADPQEGDETLAAGIHALLTNATATPADVLGIIADGAAIEVYFPGSGSPALSSGNHPVMMVAARWHQIALWCDSATSTVTGYVNGVPFGRAAVAPWNLTGSTLTSFGYGGANWGFGGSAGYYDNFLLAVGAALPDLAHQIATIRAYYRCGTLPPGIVDLYRCGETSGDVLTAARGGAAGATPSGGSYSVSRAAVGVALKPWDLT